MASLIAAQQLKHALKYALVVLLFSIIINVPKFFELKFEKEKESVSHNHTSEYYLAFSDLYNNYTFVLIYDNIVRNIVLVVVPFASLSYLNFRIYCCLRERLNLRTGEHFTELFYSSYV